MKTTGDLGAATGNARIAGRARTAALLSLLSLALASHAAERVALVPDAATVRAGQRLFHSAVAADGTPLQGALFGGASHLSGRAVACAGCHGADGQGRIDAGVPVPDIRWQALTRERRAQPGGAARPAYDELTLLRALRSGVDPAGRRLAAAMPRFEITPRQAAQLVGYLQRLGTDADQAPGVTESELRVAIIVRNDQESLGHGAAAAACLREANAQGGIYGRQVKWTVHRAGDLGDEDAWRRLSDEAALVLAPAWPNQEQLDRFTRWAAQEQLLVVGPAGVPGGDPSSTATTFRVAADPVAAWQAALDHLAARPGAGPGPLVWAVRPDAAESAPDWAAVRAHGSRHGGLRWQEVSVEDLGLDAPAKVPIPDAILVTGGAAQATAAGAWLARHQAPASVPLVASSSALGPAASRLPPGVQARLHLVHAVPLAEELKPQRLIQALRDAGVRLTSPALQTTAFAAGCVAVEALRRAGRRVTHTSLREGLESVRDFSTGVTMPLTFGGRQRQGVWGARLVRLEGDRLVAATPWLTPVQHAP